MLHAPIYIVTLHAVVPPVMVEKPWAHHSNAMHAPIYGSPMMRHQPASSMSCMWHAPGRMPSVMTSLAQLVGVAAQTSLLCIVILGCRRFLKLRARRVLSQMRRWQPQQTQPLRYASCMNASGVGMGACTTAWCWGCRGSPTSLAEVWLIL